MRTCVGVRDVPWHVVIERVVLIAGVRELYKDRFGGGHQIVASAANG
jgi:hypothetical protein